MELNKFMENMGILEMEAYNEAIDDVIITIKVLDETLDKDAKMTVHGLIEIIKGLKIN